MELRLLGPIEVHAGGQALGPGRPQQQVVLAALAVDAGRVVPTETLLDRMAGPARTRQASQLLHTHITRIRRMLEQARAMGGCAAGLEHRSGGYVLLLPPDRVDVHRFRSLVRQASDEDRPAVDRLGPLREALDLWRGEPLAGLTGAWVESTRQVWRQQRLAAVLAWARCALAVGETTAVVEALMSEVADHPLVEPLAALLMRALAADGRTAEALDHYAMVRRRLVEELGTDPGPELRAVQQAILRGELTPLARSRTAVPAHLPRDVPDFTGREQELARLDAMVTGRPGAVVLIAGTAGAGKTALAVRWARRWANRFPDGLLFLDLRGFDPRPPLSTQEALERLLVTLGVAWSGPDAAAGATSTVDDMAARYHRAIVGRRVLLVLDNAASAEQVRPLLPGSPTAAVLVTSRDSLPGLVAVEGAQRLDLDPLPAEDALALLGRLIGAAVSAEPEAAARLVEQMGRLPLALRVVAELATANSATTLAELTEDLADPRHRCQLLDAGGDPRAAVTEVFSWSLRSLPPAVLRIFRLFGSADDLDRARVAALTGLDPVDARRALDQLARANLIRPTAAGRYTTHELLRAYAHQLDLADQATNGSTVTRPPRRLAHRRRPFAGGGQPTRVRKIDKGRRVKAT